MGKTKLGYHPRARPRGGYTHNYREFMGGFTDWVGEIADSRDRADYQAMKRVRKGAGAS